MAVTDIDSLKQRASQVRDETANGANTASRIGGLMLDMVDTLGGITDLGGIGNTALDEISADGIYHYSMMGSVDGIRGYLIQVQDRRTRVYYQYRFEQGNIKARTKTSSSGGWSDWEEVGGGSPDAVLKNASNEVGDTFSLTSQNKNGDISVSAGRNASVNGGTKATVQGGTAEVKATNGNATVQASQSVNVSTTNGDINLNPGTGKVKAGGKEIATIDQIPGGITDLGVVSGWNNVVDTGIYKYTLATENGISGLLFVTSAPKRDGSGKDHYQVRMEAGKIYSRTGESLKIASGRYTWQDWEEVGGGSSVSVVQSTGQSTTAVMSQKAVTDAIDNLNAGVMQDEGLYEDVDTYGETYSRKSTNGEMVGYVNHRIEEYEVSTGDTNAFTYDDQVHTMKLAQFTIKPKSNDLSFIEQNSRGVLLDPTWSYMNFYSSNEPRFFSARIGGGKCVLAEANGEARGDHYIQLYAEACYSPVLKGIVVTVFAEYKLESNGADNNPLFINENLPGYLRIWIV